jgi:hypothetical protein
MLSFLFLFVCWVMVTLSAGIAKAEFALSPPYPATLIHSGRGALAAGSSDYSTRHHLYYSQLVPYYFSGNRRLAAAAGSMPTNHYGYHQQGELAIYIIFSLFLFFYIGNECLELDFYVAQLDRIITRSITRRIIPFIRQRLFRINITSSRIQLVSIGVI